MDYATTKESELNFRIIFLITVSCLIRRFAGLADWNPVQTNGQAQTSEITAIAEKIRKIKNYHDTL